MFFCSQRPVVVLTTFSCAHANLYVIFRYGIPGKMIALCSEDREKEVKFEANEVRGERTLRKKKLSKESVVRALPQLLSRIAVEVRRVRMSPLEY